MIQIDLFCYRMPLHPLDERFDRRVADLTHRLPTVERGGVMILEITTLSKPISATSSGTRIPASASARTAPAAMVSDIQKIASGGSGRRNSACVAVMPYSKVWGTTWNISRLKGDAVPLQRFAVGLRTQTAGNKVVRKADGSNPLPAKREEVFDHLAPSPYSCRWIRASRWNPR